MYLIAGGQLRRHIYLRDSSDKRRSSIIEPVPENWRTPTGDEDQNRQFVDVCLSLFDAISPWLVGVRDSVEWVDTTVKDMVVEDMKLVGEHNRHNHLKRQVDYIPVVIHGRPEHNASDRKLYFNFDHVQRDGVKLSWRRILNATKYSGARTISLRPLW